MQSSLVWDENDYGGVANKIVMLAEPFSNRPARSTYYDHFSLLRTLEAGFVVSITPAIPRRSWDRMVGGGRKRRPDAWCDDCANFD
jgi:hypothetical protein